MSALALLLIGAVFPGCSSDLVVADERNVDENPDSGSGATQGTGGSPSTGSGGSGSGGTSPGSAGSAGESGGTGGSVECGAGTADCNDDFDDGCEADLASRKSCGACDVVCRLTEYCADAGCVKPELTPLRGFSANVLDFVFNDDGDVYVVGWFGEPVDFGDGERSPSGSSDIFIVKYLASGELDWIKTHGSSDSNQANSVALDENGNVYVTGSLAGSADFGDGPVGTDPSTGSDLFVVSYTAEGDYRWADVYTTADNGYESGTAIVVGSERVYLAGTTGPDLDLGGGSLGDGGDTLFMLFTAAFDRDTGEHEWSNGHALIGETLATPGANFKEIAVDAHDRVYVAGSFRGTFDFGEGAIASSRVTDGELTAETYTGFVVSYAGSDGSYRWLQRQDGINDDATFALALDEEDNVYATGYFTDTPDFGAGKRPVGETSGEKIFVVSYSPDGAHRFDITGNQSQATGRGIAVHDENIYVSATIHGTAELAGASVDSTLQGEGTPTPSFDAVLLSYAKDSGTFRWVRQLGTPSGDTAGLLRMNGEMPVAIVQLGATLAIDGHTLEADPLTGTPTPWLVSVRE